MPGPRFSRNFAIGESGEVGSSSSMLALAAGDQRHAHALLRHLLDRLDARPSAS